MKDAKALYHHWMKTWGSDIGEHEREVIKDINSFVAERVSEVERLWMKEADRLGQKIYDLKKKGRP